MATTDAPGRTVKTAGTIFDIIEAVKDSESVRVTEVAEELGLAQSTVHDHLVTLESLGFLVKKDKQYRLSLKFLDYGMIARNNIDFLETATPPIKELAEQTGEVVWLYVEEHGRGVVVHKEMGDHAVETISRLGWRPYLHSTAAGKAILASLPDQRVREIIDQHGLPEQTGKTITTEDELFEELAAIRDRGYALNKGETNEGIHAVGAPIVLDDEVLGAVSVSGPSHRVSGDLLEETLTDHLLNTTAQIELELRYH